MLTLQETFRQLALDLNAVTSDDPELSRFNIDAGGTKVEVHFRDYKKELTIKAEVYVEGRPFFRITKRGPIDRLGQRLGTDETQVLSDPAFNASYELEVIDSERVDPLSLRHAIASMFADDAARAAVRQLDADEALPVLVTAGGVESLNMAAGRRDLDTKRVQTIAAGVAGLARALPAVRAEAPSNAPLVDLNGRKIIRRTKGESLAPKILGALDLWPMWLLFSGSAVLPIWLGGEAHFLSHRVALGALAFGAALVVALPLFLLILRGTKNALAFTLWRALGFAMIVAGTSYFGAHFFDMVGDNARPKKERATIVSVRPTLGPMMSTTTLRTSRNETWHILNEDFGKVGETINVDVHPGRLGWRWIEQTHERD